MAWWKPPMGKWRKFQRLTWLERGVFFQALFLLPIAALALRLMGLRRTQAVLMRLTRTSKLLVESEESTRHQQTLAIARMVRAAASHGPYRANCLKQSLVLWWLLRLRGIGSELRVGVRRMSSGIEAHAWVVCGNRLLNEREDVYTEFAPFDRAVFSV
jgi:hypothetical protein